MRDGSSNTTGTPAAPRVGLALAGGGPLGAIYEIGALCALQESLQGLDLTRLQHYVGVSAGAFIAAALANGMSPRELCAGFIENSDSAQDDFDPAWLTMPAYGEYLQRAALLPELLLSMLWRGPGSRASLLHSLEQMGRALPTGLFSSEEVHRRLARAFSRSGRSNDFRRLSTRLTLVATNLDSGQAVLFGRPGQDHVPISRAVQASSALPGLFPPVVIDGRYYVDGALRKTMHASVALDDGVDLMLCLNPLVPFNAVDPHDQAAPAGTPADQHRIPHIVEGGLPAVLSQTFRTLIHSRMELGMKQYAAAYPGVDILLFEPDQRDPQLYLANTFGYGRRRELAEHAFQQTRRMLLARSTHLADKLERHGVQLRLDRLQDPARRLIKPTDAPTRIGQAVASLRQTLDTLGTHLASRAA